jgi:predicted SAM-dependent methyltransferase
MAVIEAAVILNPRRDWRMSKLFFRIRRKMFEWGIFGKRIPSGHDAATIRRLLALSNRLHIGCGDVRLPGFINMDFRQTMAADIAADCTKLSVFPPESLGLVYSHAFFEHLYQHDRERNLKSVYDSLRKDGQAVYIGLPDFRIIAQAYLNREKGVIGEVFDLYNVYRYTHGDPEHVKGWWLEQLHKSLFDAETVDDLLARSGFRYYCIFNYSFRDEHLPLNLGFIAFKSKPQHELTKDWVMNNLRQITDVVKSESLTMISVKA